MNAFLKSFLAVGVALLLATGCTTTQGIGSAANKARKPTITAPVPVMMAQAQLPEAQLMDIGIQHFGQSLVNKAATERNAELGSTENIRKAEGHYIPVHLKNTLQKTGYWGAVRVTPGPTDSVDVTVRGKIIESNGYALDLMVSPVGSDGRTWYNRRYSSESGKHSYMNTQRGERDPYQDVYNAIANDLLAYRNSLGSQEVNRLKMLSKLKFAADLAPDAFGNTVAKGTDGTYRIRSLPAEGDPMFNKLMEMREREYMVVDIINEHYEDYYNEMWEPYKQWREFSRQEAENLKEVKTKSRNRKLLGAAVLVGTVAAEVLSGGEVPGTLTQIGVIGGIEAIKSGMSIGQEAEMHQEALAELGESFGADIEPRVVTVEGKTMELRGTATEQYAQWRDLLRQIYAEETGFGMDPGPAPSDYVPVPDPVPAPASYPPAPVYPPASSYPPPTPSYPQPVASNSTTINVPAPASGGYYPATGEVPEIDPEYDPELDPEYDPEVNIEGNTGTIRLPEREGYRPGVQ